MDILAHHLKHVKNNDEKFSSSPLGISIARVLGIDDAGEKMDLRNLYFVIRDAVRFVHKKVGTIYPKLP